jgi:hypothetical protein
VPWGRTLVSHPYSSAPLSQALPTQL